MFGADRVSAAAEKLCLDAVQPYLPSVLDEMMEPISSGFQEGRQLRENAMERVCQDIQAGGVNDELKKVRQECLTLSAADFTATCWSKSFRFLFFMFLQHSTPL